MRLRPHDIWWNTYSIWFLVTSCQHHHWNHAFLHTDTQWLLIQATVPFSFFWQCSAGILLQDRYTWCYFSWLADACKTRLGSLVALPSLHPLDIYSAKQKIQTILNKEECYTARVTLAKSHSAPRFRHIISLVCSRNLEIYLSKPAMLILQFEVNWLCSVLHDRSVHYLTSWVKLSFQHSGMNFNNNFTTLLVFSFSQNLTCFIVVDG